MPVINPSIAAAARKHLAAQAAPAPSERLFSRASRLATPLCTSMSPEMTSALLYAGENLPWHGKEMAKLADEAEGGGKKPAAKEAAPAKAAPAEAATLQSTVALDEDGAAEAI